MNLQLDSMVKNGVSNTIWPLHNPVDIIDNLVFDRISEPLELIRQCVFSDVDLTNSVLTLKDAVASDIVSITDYLGQDVPLGSVSISEVGGNVEVDFSSIGTLIGNWQVILSNHNRADDSTYLATDVDNNLNVSFDYYNKLSVDVPKVVLYKLTEEMSLLLNKMYNENSDDTALQTVYSALHDISGRVYLTTDSGYRLPLTLCFIFKDRETLVDTNVITTFDENSTLHDNGTITPPAPSEGNPVDLYLAIPYELLQGDDCNGVSMKIIDKPFRFINYDDYLEDDTSSTFTPEPDHVYYYNGLLMPTMGANISPYSVVMTYWGDDNYLSEVVPILVSSITVSGREYYLIEVSDSNLYTFKNIVEIYVSDNGNSYKSLGFYNDQLIQITPHMILVPVDIVSLLVAGTPEFMVNSYEGLLASRIFNDKYYFKELHEYHNDLIAHLDPAQTTPVDYPSIWKLSSLRDSTINLTGMVSYYKLDNVPSSDIIDKFGLLFTYGCTRPSHIIIDKVTNRGNSGYDFIYQLPTATKFDNVFKVSTFNAADTIDLVDVNSNSLKVDVSNDTVPYMVNRYEKSHASVSLITPGSNPTIPRYAYELRLYIYRDSDEAEYGVGWYNVTDTMQDYLYFAEINGETYIKVQWSSYGEMFALCQGTYSQFESNVSSTEIPLTEKVTQVYCNDKDSFFIGPTNHVDNDSLITFDHYRDEGSGPQLVADVYKLGVNSRNIKLELSDYKYYGNVYFSSYSDNFIEPGYLVYMIYENDSRSFIVYDIETNKVVNTIACDYNVTLGDYRVLDNKIQFIDSIGSREFRIIEYDLPNITTVPTITEFSTISDQVFVGFTNDTSINHVVCYDYAGTVTVVEYTSQTSSSVVTTTVLSTTSNSVIVRNSDNKTFVQVSSLTLDGGPKVSLSIFIYQNGTLDLNEIGSYGSVVCTDHGVIVHDRFTNELNIYRLINSGGSDHLVHAGVSNDLQLPNGALLSTIAATNDITVVSGYSESFDSIGIYAIYWTDTGIVVDEITEVEYGMHISNRLINRNEDAVGYFDSITSGEIIDKEDGEAMILFSSRQEFFKCRLRYRMLNASDIFNVDAVQPDAMFSNNFKVTNKDRIYINPTLAGYENIDVDIEYIGLQIEYATPPSNIGTEVVATPTMSTSIVEEDIPGSGYASIQNKFNTPIMEYNSNRLQRIKFVGFTYELDWDNSVDKKIIIPITIIPAGGEYIEFPMADGEFAYIASIKLLAKRVGANVPIEVPFLGDADIGLFDANDVMQSDATNYILSRSTIESKLIVDSGVTAPYELCVNSAVCVSRACNVMDSNGVAYPSDVQHPSDRGADLDRYIDIGNVSTTINSGQYSIHSTYLNIEHLSALIARYYTTVEYGESILQNIDILKQRYENTGVSVSLTNNDIQILPTLYELAKVLADPSYDPMDYNNAVVSAGVVNPIVLSERMRLHNIPDPSDVKDRHVDTRVSTIDVAPVPMPAARKADMLLVAEYLYPEYAGYFYYN